MKSSQNDTTPAVVPAGRFVDILQAAEMLGVSDKTLRRWDARNYGPRADRVGLKRNYRYLRADIVRWLAANADEDTVEINRSAGREVA